MCSGHDIPDPDGGSADEVDRDLSRRGFLRTAAVGAAAMDSPVRSPPLPRPTTPETATAAHTGFRPTGSASSCIRCATSQPSTWREPSPVSPTSAIDGWSTQGSWAARSTSSKPPWTPWESAPLRAMSASRSPSTPPRGGPPCRTRSRWAPATSSTRSSASTSEPARWCATERPGLRSARDLNRAGRMARQVGLRLGYHNHNWEFFRLTDDPSMTAYDVLIEETDRRYVHFAGSLLGRQGRA